MCRGFLIPLTALVAVASATFFDGPDPMSGPPVALEVSRSTVSSGRARQRPLARRTSADKLYSYHETLVREVEPFAFSERGWTVEKAEDTRTISVRAKSGDPACPYVKMVATIDADPATVWDFFEIAQWAETMPRMDPFYEGHDQVESYRVRTNRGSRSKARITLARRRTKRIIAFGKRDFAFAAVSDVPRRDGTLVSSVLAVDSPLMPRSSQYVRAFQDSVVFYEAVPSATSRNGIGCRITIIVRIDLNDGEMGGYMPMWLYVKTVGSSGMQSLRAMQRDIVAWDQKRILRRETR